MKITNSYDYQAIESLAAFKLKFVNLFWKTFDFGSLRKATPSKGVFEEAEILDNTLDEQKDRETYFIINRAFSTAIEDHVNILHINHITSGLHRKHIPEKELEKHVLNEMTHKLAQTLMKSEHVGVTKIEDPFTGDLHFSLSIPFISIKGEHKGRNCE
jgi:hypothetical protein